MPSAPHASAESFTPTTPQELARFVEANALGPRRPLTPVGGRTALQSGPVLPPGVVTIETGGIARVVDYPARDMTVTVEAGLRIDDLQTLLRAQGQRLAVDVAQAHRATLGGALATNTSGPRRFSQGTFRDYVLGISAVDGQGRLFSAGGRVVKNVAGYDLCKLLVGSAGSLGIITRVTLKLKPLPESSRLVWCPFRGLDAIDRALQMLLASRTRPAAIEVLNSKGAWQLGAELKQQLASDEPVLCVAYEGTSNEVAWQADVFCEEIAPLQPTRVLPCEGEAATRLWQALVEYQAASDDPLTFRATVLPSRVTALIDAATAAGIAVQSHAANGIVIGHLPDRCATADDALACLAPLRAATGQCGGDLAILSCEPAWRGRLSEIVSPRGDRALLQRVKAAFDPHGVLNPLRT